MKVTDVGMKMDGRERQTEKAPIPMVVTEVEKDTEERE